MITIQQIKDFCSRPGINMAGVCKEADVSQQYILRKISENALPGPKVMDKLLPVMKRYGFEL